MTSEPRTAGGSLLRAALDEAQAQANALGADGVSVYMAYDRETGAEMGAAVSWRTARGHEWALTGTLSRRAMTATAPYAVRLELRGRL